VAAAHEGRAEENKVTLRAATRGKLELTADPARLRQALGKLVANAVRYTPPDGEVTIVGRREGGNIVPDVIDTGLGISAEDLPHVFDRFWRADKSRSRHTGGSGLGLAFTRHLAEAQGGSVSAESVLGEGSPSASSCSFERDAAGRRRPFRLVARKDGGVHRRLRALVQAQNGASKTAHEANETKNETTGLLTRRRPGPRERPGPTFWLVVLAEDTRFELVGVAPNTLSKSALRGPPSAATVPHLS
jgi:signal transduction histidine kinase